MLNHLDCALELPDALAVRSSTGYGKGANLLGDLVLQDTGGKGRLPRGVTQKTFPLESNEGDHRFAIVCFCLGAGGP